MSDKQSQFITLYKTSLGGIVLIAAETLTGSAVLPAHFHYLFFTTGTLKKNRGHAGRGKFDSGGVK